MNAIRVVYNLVSSFYSMLSRRAKITLAVCVVVIVLIGYLYTKKITNTIKTLTMSIFNNVKSIDTNTAKTIVTSVTSLVVGIFIGYFIACNYLCGKADYKGQIINDTVYRVKDTCITYVEKCKISREDSIKIYTHIRKSQSSLRYTDISTADTIRLVDTLVVYYSDTTDNVNTNNDSQVVHTSSFNKSYDWGLVRLKVGIDAKAHCPVTFSNYSIEYELDTLVIKEQFKTVETVILEKPTNEVIKYVPVTHTFSKIGVGVSTLVDFNNTNIGSTEANLGVGAFYQTNAGAVFSLDVYPAIDAVELGLRFPISNVKGKARIKNIKD